MLLVHMDTHKLVTEQMVAFFTHSQLTFQEIKRLILAKAIIPSVHSKVIEEIEHLRDTNYYKVQLRLEQQAYNLQETEDSKEHELERNRDQKIKSDIVTLKQELETIPEEKLYYEKRCITIQAELRELTLNMRKSRRDDSNDDAIRILKKSLVEHELKILDLSHRQNAIEMKLHELKSKSKTLFNHEVNRKSRKQARIGYHASTEGIFDTLSTTNSKQLRNNLNTQKIALDKKSQDLIQDAERINYAIFLEQLQLHLNTLNLNDNEREACQNIIKFMHLHLEAEAEIFRTESLVVNKRSSLSKQMERMHALTLRASELEQNKPKLIEENASLTEENTILTPSYINNTQNIRRFKIPAFALLAVSLILFIPAALYFFGFITLFATVALNYALVISPPVLALLTSIALGITSAVYYFKSSSLDEAIKSNEQLIDNNLHQLKKEASDLILMRSHTIPNLNQQISRDEHIREQLLPQIEQQRTVSAEYLNKAQAIEPTRLMSNIFTRDQSNVQTPVIEDEQDESFNSDRATHENFLANS